MNAHDQGWKSAQRLSRHKVIVINIDKLIDALYIVAALLAVLGVYAVVDLHEQQVEVEISNAGPDIFCPVEGTPISIRCAP